MYDFATCVSIQTIFSRYTKAGETQLAELQKTAEVQRVIAADANSNIADETYPIDQLVDLPSRSEPQTVVITDDSLNGELYSVVTPILSSFGYREAKITNTLPRSLIAGAAKVFLDDQYIGQTTLPPTVAGQKFIAGFGVDRHLRTRRELLSRLETIRGGNRHTDLRYRLVISNYHPQPIDIRLFDRMPITPKDEAIEVNLDESAAGELSDDGLYERMQKPIGILRWDLTIPADRFGSDAFDFEYGYSIELDREQTITGANMVERMESDYQFDKFNGGGMGGGMF